MPRLRVPPPRPEYHPPHSREKDRQYDALLNAWIAGEAMRAMVAAYRVRWHELPDDLPLKVTQRFGISSKDTTTHIDGQDVLCRYFERQEKQVVPAYKAWRLLQRELPRTAEICWRRHIDLRSVAEIASERHISMRRVSIHLHTANMRLVAALDAKSPTASSQKAARREERAAEEAEAHLHRTPEQSDAEDWTPMEQAQAGETPPLLKAS